MLVNTVKWLCSLDVNTERACVADLLFLTYLGMFLQVICYLMNFQGAEVKHQVQYKQVIYYINKCDLNYSDFSPDTDQCKVNSHLHYTM